MKINVSITHDAPKAPVRGVYRVPDVGLYYQSVQDIYSGAWMDRNGRPCPRSMVKWRNPPYMSLPSTVPLPGALKIGEFFPLMFEWQYFWLDLIDRATEYTLSRERLPLERLTPSHLLYWYAYATQHSLALTDSHAAVIDGHSDPNGFADYVLELNLQNPKPIAIKSLSMSGNIYRMLGMHGSYMVIETLNAGTINSSGKFVPALPPSVDEVWDKPWLIHWCVESTANNKLADGSYPQGMFPPRPYGLPFPLMGIDGRNWISPSRVKAVENGSVFSPYWPIPI